MRATSLAAALLAANVMWATVQASRYLARAAAMAREIADVLSASGEAVSAAALRKRYERLKERLARRARDEGLVD